MYCKKCGKEIADDSKFCQYCGTSFENEEKAKTEPNQARKSVYDGVIHKCPNCGQVLDSFTAICPACGYEIQKEYGEKNAIDIFTENLISMDSIEKKKVYIENFNVPNTRKDLTEFSDYVIATIKPHNETNDYLVTMMNKILYKAEHSFGKESAIYSEFLTKYNKAQKLNDDAKAISEKEDKEREETEKKEKRRENIKTAIKTESKTYKFVMLIIGVLLIAVSIVMICVPQQIEGKISTWSYVGMGILVIAIAELVFVFKKNKKDKTKK